MAQTADQVRIKLISQLHNGILGDTIRHVKIFVIISNECQFYFSYILVVCKCIQRNILICTFIYEQMFFEIFVAKGNTGQLF